MYYNPNSFKRGEAKIISKQNLIIYIFVFLVSKIKLINNDKLFF